MQNSTDLKNVKNIIRNGFLLFLRVIVHIFYINLFLMNKILLLVIAFFLVFAKTSQSQNLFTNKNIDVSDRIEYYKNSKPLTRWWWFASVIDGESVRDNLSWLKNNGFGGVEIAWVYPLNRMKKDTVNYTPRQEWLSGEWSDVVAYTKKCADSLGLSCDFTFGTLWPFGDSKVPFDEAAMNMTDKNRRQEITASWEYPKKGFVIDHLNRKAFYNYAERIGSALVPALNGGKSGLFCDSWEVETRYLTTQKFEDAFFKAYGYKIGDYIDSLYSKSEKYSEIRYDYMRLLSEFVIEEFYKPYTDECHKLGAFSRVQCSGAPCDILSAYATVDVPESEALLFEPAFSNIVLSSAALTGKRIVTSETFTCLYGWPGIRLGEEQTADLKLLADALFANGVNQIIWHGKPFNPAGYDTVKFYASVHVGSSGNLAPEIPAFNKYMEKVSSYMKKGVAYSDVAVYLPVEDGYVNGDLPKEKQFIWAWGEYEQRYTYLPEELKGYSPLWINGEFLEKAKYENGYLRVGGCAFKALYVDVKWMDYNSLKAIVRLAQDGLPVFFKNIPLEPGLGKSDGKYQALIYRLKNFKNFRTGTEEIKYIKPLIEGVNIPDYKCRQTNEGLYVFFANPKSEKLKFPLEYGQSFSEKTVTRDVIINTGEKTVPVTLNFAPYQSLLLRIGKNGETEFIDIKFVPKTPLVIPRVKPEKERWEVK